MEAMGRARVVVEDGKVVEVGKPIIEYCPLFKKHRGIDRLDEDSIRENIEFRIRDFGMCTPQRKMFMEDFLSFGVSELICMGVEEGALDAAVLVGDGVGTCVVDDPAMIQGIGGRISGVVSTEVIPELVDTVGEDRCLGGAIDQVAGAELAFSLGFESVAVSVAIGDDARALKERFGDRVMTFAVHTTGCDRRDAEDFFSYCDVVTGCASLHVRELAKERALLQVGERVPAYAATKKGKELMEMKLRQLGKSPASGDSEDPPRPLV